MTVFRAISLSAHGAIEIVLGFATMVAPFLFGFSVAGGVVAMLVGLLLVGAALSTVDARTVNVAAHYAFDNMAALGVLVAALALGIFVGDRHATAYLAAVAVVQLGLNLGTRYTAA
ncbi:MAG: hypothetical protein JWN32_3714 [Solirubrobacterales bacterium]|nr:hypothetical protein [Solirubrobacterales bacterium]